jgi:hypothetical protein
MSVDQYFTMSKLEQEAEAMLRLCGRSSESLSNAPIPADEILEFDLGLTLDFGDLQTPGKRGALASLHIESKQVFVDERLDPCLYPKNKGRFNFTIAHEIGHWQLHRGQRDKSNGPLTTIDEFNTVCAEQENRRLEWEANYFAACLLMPRTMVEAAWVQAGGRLDRGLVYDPVRHARFTRRNRRGFVSMENIVNGLMEPRERILFNKVAAEIAPTFEVSVEAMRIRLENLGLLRGEPISDEDRLRNFFIRLANSR